MSRAGGLVRLEGDGIRYAERISESDADFRADDSAEWSGAVYVLTRAGTTWTQQASLKASNTDAGDRFGWSLALSADGNSLALGAFEEDSAATGVDGNQADNSELQSGAVYTRRIAR